MSYTDLYLNANSSITSPDDGSEPVATVFGVPFDATHSYKPGCRFGPDAIRGAFDNIEIFHPDLGVDLESVCIGDAGNVRHTAVPSEMIKMVRRVTAELIGKGRPVIMLGGEHSITYGAYTSFPKDVGYVVFDAHYDLRDEFDDTPLSHASYLRRVVEERGADRILHVGARAFVREELEFLRENSIRTISDAQIRAGQGPQLLQDYASSFGSLYASFDLDVLDPAFAPGVGNPEAVGVTSRELFEMIHSLRGTRLSGADIVELNPYHDNGSTASLAAKILSVLVAQSVALAEHNARPGE